MTKVERFEGYCLRKRSLEGDIELVLARRDDTALEAMELAERELDNTKRECAEIEARIERARRRDFDKAEAFRFPLESRLHASQNVMKDGGAPQTCGGNIPSANAASNEPTQPEAVIEPSSSIPTSAADSDSFSVVSAQPQAASTRIDQESSSNPSDHLEDNTSDDLLGLLVQRYTDLCHERRILQEEIEDRLERKERLAAERFRCAKIALETTRQRAVEIVAALNEASGGETEIKLSAASIYSTSISPPADRTHASGSGPIGLCTKVHAPIVDPAQPATPTPPPKETTPPPSIVVLPEPNAVCSSGVEHHSQSLLRHIPAPQLPAATPITAPDPLLQLPSTETQQAIFTKYEEGMVAAKAAGSGLSMEKVPWPLLAPTVSQYPQKYIVASQNLENSRVTVFVEGYARWKSWDLKVEGQSVLADWEQLYSQVPVRKQGGKICMQKVVLILRTLVRS